jgi:hypothetical protein
MNGDRTELVTNCGRRLTAGRFRIPASPRLERVVLRIDPDDECRETVWASFTADEAIAVARALLAQAEQIGRN